MATDADLLKGEVSENPGMVKVDVEKMLMGFLTALMEEQGLISNEARDAHQELPAVALPPALAPNPQGSQEAIVNG